MFLLFVKGDLYVNGRSKIVERDIGYQGGIAFGISEVLLPPGVGGRCDVIKYEPVQVGFSLPLLSISAFCFAANVRFIRKALKALSRVIRCNFFCVTIVFTLYLKRNVYGE